MSRIQFLWPVNKNQSNILANLISIELQQRDFTRRFGFEYEAVRFHDEVKKYMSGEMRRQKEQRDIADVMIRFQVAKNKHLNWPADRRVKTKMRSSRAFHVYFREKNGKLYVSCYSNYLMDKKYVRAEFVYTDEVQYKIVDKIEKYIEKEIKETDEIVERINTPKKYKMYQEIRIDGVPLQNSIMLYDGLLEYQFKNINGARKFLRKNNGILADKFDND